MPNMDLDEMQKRAAAASAHYTLLDTIYAMAQAMDADDAYVVLNVVGKARGLEISNELVRSEIRAVLLGHAKRVAESGPDA